MKTSNIFFGIGITMTFALGACTSDENLSTEYSKQAIDFNSDINIKAIVSATSRANTTNGSEIAFKKATEIVLSIKSDKKDGSASDVKNAANTKATVAAATTAAPGPKTAVTFQNDDKRYWDDLWGRDAQLTVYAVGVEGKTIAEVNASTNGNKLELDSNNKIKWNLTAVQDTNTYKLEDLLISNNNKLNGSDDKRLKYNSSNAFDKGNLLFKHAMSKITINLKKDASYSSTEFQNPEVTYKGFYTSATVNAADGSVALASGATTTDITPIKAGTPTSGYNFTYDALVIPSRNWDATSNQPVFVIKTDDNTYTVNTNDFNKGSGLINFLEGNMLAGNQYIFNVTIGKSGIKVTASLCDWISNTTNITPVIVKGSGIGHNFDKDKVTYFDMYRSLNIDNGYDEKTSTISYTTTDGFKMTPLVYWPNHEDAYYFRAIGELDEAGNIITSGTLPKYEEKTFGSGEDAKDKSVIDVKTAKKDGNSYVKDGADIILGAPYESDSKGGVAGLTEAKKAGDGDINFTFKHVMSEVYVHLKTTNDADSVSLAGAKVEIINSYTQGYIESETNSFGDLSNRQDYSLGDKQSSTTGKLPNETTVGYDNVYRGYTIPQDLTYTDSETTKYVQIKVTTADGNTYFVNCKTDDFSSWKEGNQYLYNLTLKKTKSELTASIIDWVTGKVANIGVQL